MVEDFFIIVFDIGVVDGEEVDRDVGMIALTTYSEYGISPFCPHCGGGFFRATDKWSLGPCVGVGDADDHTNFHIGFVELDVV